MKKVFYDLRNLCRSIKENAYTILAIIGMIGAVCIIISFIQSNLSFENLRDYDWELNQWGQNGVYLCIFSNIMMVFHTITKFIEEKIFKITF